MPTRQRRLLSLLAISLPGLISIPLVAGFLGELHPAFDSFAHFRAHLGVLLAISALAPLFAGMWKEALAAVILGAASLSTTAVDLAIPGFGAPVADARPDDRAVYRLLQLNLLYNNEEPEKALSVIGRTQPDVITLDEVSEMWVGKLALLKAAYPYQHICPSLEKIGGVAILSRRPFVADAKPYCLSGGRYGVVRVDFGGQVIDVAALHLTWPWPGGQSRQIDRLTPDLAGLLDNALLAGDFNAAGWSTAVTRLMQAGHFMRVPPVGPTWLSKRLPASWRAYIGLPLDHVLARGMVRMHSAATAGDAGSDHAPLLVEFSIEGTGTMPPDGEDTTTALLAR